MPIPLGILAVAGAGAAGGGAYDLLETTVLTSSASSVTFSSLGSYSDYKHLQLRIVARRGDSAGTYTTIRMRMNGVTSGSYAYHRLEGDGSSVVSAADGTSDTRIEFAAISGDDSGTNPADSFGAVIADILDFSSSSKNTTVRALSGFASSGNSRIRLASGLFNNTAAVTSLEVYNTVNFEIGSRFSLYGVK